MITRTLVLGVFGLAGCSQNAEPAPTTPPVAITAPVPTPADRPPVAVPPSVTTQPVEPIATQPPKPPEPPTVFDYPTDLGGKAVVKAVTPAIGKLLPEKLGATPKPRVPPARLLDPDAIPKAEYVPPPILPTKPVEAKPTPPAERVPLDIGQLADAIPAKPTFPVAPGIADRARDVKLPPTMAILGRPFNERVSLEDPTAEFGNTGIVAPLVRVPVAQTGFLRVSLPDPFELGEQVKPRVPPASDPGLAPVVVNPQRVK
ncbi:MAG: hypothetical protein K8U57_39955 [Planctomycetes bacterium]|nr:hypothetical protein [Planctomycetota bacterium]